MWFPSFLRRRSAERPQRPARRKAPTTRLGVEALEDRLALSAAASQDWAMFNQNPEGTRHNAAETRLNTGNVGGLHEQWRFPTAGVISSTPVVVNAVDSTATVYALDRDGGLRWRTAVEVPTALGVKVAASLTVPRGVVIFGDLSGHINGLSAATGDAFGNHFQLFVPSDLGTITALGIHDAHAGRGSQARPLKGSGAGRFTDDVGGFFATGIMSHLGEFTHYGTLVLAETEDPLVLSVSGDITYEADNGDKLYGSVSGTLNVLTWEVSATDTWTGGTGRFADATGSAEVTGLLTGATFTFELVGTLGY